MKKLFYLLMTAVIAVTSLSFVSCSKDDENSDLELKKDYDVIQINGDNYACYGARCFITYASTWDAAKEKATIRIPYGFLDDAEKGEAKYNHVLSIALKGAKNLSKGSKLESLSPVLSQGGEPSNYNYVSGSATITDMGHVNYGNYMTVKFDSFMCKNRESKTYTLNGTVQLALDEE